MTIASLPMYDLPEIAPHTNRWWKGFARAFRREAPSILGRDPMFGPEFGIGARAFWETGPNAQLFE